MRKSPDITLDFSPSNERAWEDVNGLRRGIQLSCRFERSLISNKEEIFVEEEWK